MTPTSFNPGESLPNHGSGRAPSAHGENGTPWAFTGGAPSDPLRVE